MEHITHEQIQINRYFFLMKVLENDQEQNED